LNLESNENQSTESTVLSQEDDALLHPRLRLHKAFQSSYLPDDRDVIVYVPPGYDEEPERKYPVLYLHDGQNLFDGRTSFVKDRTWQVREHADAAIEAGEVVPLVIVDYELPSSGCRIICAADRLGLPLRLVCVEDVGA